MDNLSNTLMKPNQIRVDNMNHIIATKFGGSVKAFALAARPDKTEYDNYISQIRTGKKAFSEKNAEIMEDNLNLPRGYLSRQHFDYDADLSNINDFAAMELAIKVIMGQFIASGVYEPKMSMDSGTFAAFVIAEYKKILDKKALDNESSVESKTNLG